MGKLSCKQIKAVANIYASSLLQFVEDSVESKIVDVETVNNVFTEVQKIGVNISKYEGRRLGELDEIIKYVIDNVR